MAHGADVVGTGNVLGQKDRGHAGHGARLGGIAPQDLGAGVRRHHRPQLEHGAPSVGFVVDILRAARDVAPAALVVQRARRIVGRRFVCAGKIERLVLRAALVAGEKFFQQAHHQAAAIGHARAHVGDGGQLGGQAAPRLGRQLARPLFADEQRLGLQRANGRRRHAAVRQTRRDDLVVAVEIDAEAGSHDADVELAALTDLVRLRDSPQAHRRIRKIDGAHDLARLKKRLAVADEKIRQRDFALDDDVPVEPRQHQARLQRQQDRRQIANRRGRHQVAGDGRAMANLPRGEHPQHLVERGNRAPHRFLHRRQRRRTADAPAVAVPLDDAQLVHRFGGNQQRKCALLLVDLDAHLGRAGDQICRRMCGMEPQQIEQRRRPPKALSAGAVVERLDGGERLGQPDGEPIGGRLHVALGLPHVERVGHGVANRAIAGAATQISVELLGDLVRRLRGHLRPVIALEHRDHEARRTVAALRSVALDHRLLHRVQHLAGGQPLDGDHLAAGEHGHERDAAVDGAIGPPAVCVALHDGNRARTAVPLSAPLFAPSQSFGAQPAQQGGVRRNIAHGVGPSIDGDGERFDHFRRV